MHHVYFLEFHFSMVTNISFLLNDASYTSLRAGCLSNLIWWSSAMFLHLKADTFSCHWNVPCTLQISSRSKWRKKQAYRSKRHTLGKLERMSSVLNKIHLQLPLRTTSSNHPPQGNKKINYCYEPKKSLHVPLRSSFPKQFFLIFRESSRVSRKYVFPFIKRIKIFLQEPALSSC